jgi:hypothetical protein
VSPWQHDDSDDQFYGRICMWPEAECRSVLVMADNNLDALVYVYTTIPAPLV